MMFCKSFQRPIARACACVSRSLLRVVMLALVLAAARPAAAASQSVTLKNGLRVVLTNDPLATATDVALWFPSGARSEREGRAGLAHVAERVVARLGAQAAEGRYMKQVGDAGGTPGSSSTSDYTEFFETVPAEVLPAALRIEAARLALVPLDAALFEIERKRAREDLVRAQRTPVARGLQRVFAALYPGDAYARPIAGNERDLAALTARDVDAWRRDHLAAGAATLTITGRFEPEATLALVRSLFETLPRGETSAPAPAFKPVAVNGADGVERGDAPARVLFAAWRAPGAADPDAPATALLAQVLAVAGSPFEKSLVQDWKVAALVQAGLTERRESSTLWTLAVLQAGADSSTARRVLLDAVKSLAREPLTGEVFDRVLRQWETSEALRLQGVRARGQALGESAMLRAAPSEDARFAAVRALTPADLQRAAARVVAEGNLAAFWLLPTQTVGGR